ncbi:MAG: carbohydrate ABC transporter permease [Lachnospiraceae bacterium]|nr:carbohydrate ABC transporter permease [Lachnospiraceae bacterium]
MKTKAGNVEKSSKLGRILVYIILLIVSFTMLVPFLWMVLTAFMTQTESTQVNPFVIIPANWQLNNFRDVIDSMNFMRLYGVTVALIVGRVIAAVLTATLAGYAFARLEFFGKKVLFTIVVVQLMIPSQIFIIPQFQMVQSLGQLDTFFALMFPGLVTAFGTFLLRQAYLGLPRDLEEAAILDGCNIGQVFLFVMAPLVKASMVALGIFTAIFAYRELLWPLIVNRTLLPLSAALASLQGQFVTHFPRLMAAAVLATIPMIIIYLIFQKHFVEGIATAGGKL